MKGFGGTLKNSWDSTEREGNLSSRDLSKEKSNLSSVLRLKGDLTSKDSLEKLLGLKCLKGVEGLADLTGAEGRLGAEGRGLDGAEKRGISRDTESNLASPEYLTSTMKPESPST
ncbi:hypothetical protein Pmani_015257 [Petrolisthes manimaculis]|uniref:Uncharacterized protein n=1 Tax=Petrolisthes manimaculis TaxID=1843537 RepID=A0AAE1PR87_9EUCA|nr:hypothetical protein Pmani_015257 [Petrolisthes manimaculis]